MAATNDAHYSVVCTEGMDKADLFALYKKVVWDVDDVYVGKLGIFNTRLQSILKLLRDRCEDGNAGQYKSSSFWDTSIRVDLLLNRYSKPQRTETFGLVFQACFHLDKLNSEKDVEVKYKDPLNPEGPPVLFVAGIITKDVCPEGSFGADVLQRAFPDVKRIDFYMKFVGSVPEPVSEATASMAMHDARQNLCDKIVEIEQVRAALQEHVEKYKPQFANLTSKLLQTSVDEDEDCDKDAGTASADYTDDDEDDQPTKKRPRKTYEQMGTERDTLQQQVNTSSICIKRESGLRSMRTRDFKVKDGISTHAIDFAGCMGNYRACRERMPFPEIPVYSSGAEVGRGGITLKEPSLDVEGDTIMTQHLIDSGLRDPYETMLKLHTQLLDNINQVTGDMCSNFGCQVVVIKEDDKREYFLPLQMSPTQKYAVGVAFMNSIAIEKDGGGDEDEAGEEESEQLEEDDGSGEDEEYEASSSEEEEDGEDSDEDEDTSGYDSESV